MPTSVAASMEAFDQQVGTSGLEEDERLLRFDYVPEYAEFFDRCLLPNRPCILPRALIAHWDVVRSQAWQLSSTTAEAETETEEGEKEVKVDWEALKRDFGTHISPVVITKLQANSEIQEDRSDMSIATAVELIHAFKSGKQKSEVQSIYIKDWHLIKQLGMHNPHGFTEPYTVPEVFADDWMNNLPHPGTAAFSSANGQEGESKAEMDDFRFVYAGTKGSQTLLHRDVYTSYSWSTNVVGRKRWYLFPPRTIPHLRRFPTIATSPLIPDISTLLKTLESRSKPNSRNDYPNLDLAWNNVQIIDQQQGETIFIPSDWYHQVCNVTECISINRNWCNSVNLPNLYRSIVAELAHAEESLSDVRQLLSTNSPQDWNKEFYTLVQDVAIKDAGWAWFGFWSMLLHNLKYPATRNRIDLRPNTIWVKKRLLPLVDEFENREDAKWLEEELRETVQQCRELLERLDE